MTYRHITTKNYMTYDIEFSHIVAALVGSMGYSDNYCGYQLQEQLCELSSNRHIRF